MNLDYLFSMLGVTGTSFLLLGILALLGTPAVGQIACPMSTLRRMQPRGR